MNFCFVRANVEPIASALGHSGLIAGRAWVKDARERITYASADRGGSATGESTRSSERQKQRDKRQNNSQQPTTRPCKQSKAQLGPVRDHIEANSQGHSPLTYDMIAYTSSDDVRVRFVDSRRSKVHRAW